MARFELHRLTARMIKTIDEVEVDVLDDFTMKAIIEHYPAPNLDEGEVIGTEEIEGYLLPVDEAAQALVDAHVVKVHGDTSAD